jgi:hypothetical protein
MYERRRLNSVNSFIFWDITLYIRLKVRRRFGGTCRHHLQSRRISQTRNRHEVGGSACYLLNVGFLLSLLFYSEDGGDMFLRIVC